MTQNDLIYSLDNFFPSSITDDLGGFEIVSNQISISIDDMVSAKDRLAYWTWAMMHFQLWRHPIDPDTGMQKYTSANQWVADLTKVQSIGTSTVWRDYSALAMFINLGYTIQDYHAVGITRLSKIRTFVKLDENFLPTSFNQSADRSADPVEKVKEAISQAMDNASGDLMTADFNANIEEVLRPGIARIWFQKDSDAMWRWHFEPNDGSLTHLSGRVSWGEDKNNKSFRFTLLDNPPNEVRYWFISNKAKLT